MVTSKIIQLIKKLNSSEHARFREFLCSPFFNKKSKLVELYDNLLKYSPDFRIKKDESKEIYQNLYNGSKFNAQVYKNLSSELYSLAKLFIAASQLKESTHEQNMSILTKLEMCGADELYKTELKAAKKKLNESKFYDLQYLHNLEILMLERTFCYNRSEHKKILELTMEESNELLKFYLVHSFRHRFDYETAGLSFNVQFEENAAMRHIGKLLEQGFIQDTIDHMNSLKTRDREIIALFYYILMSFKHPDNSHYFNRAKELVFNNIDKFNKATAFEISGALYSLFTYKLRLSGTIEDYRSTFDIINFRLNKKIYKENDDSFINAISFRAIFMTASRLNEHNWVKKFLKKYINEVTPEHRENLNLLLQAFIKFYDKKFNESLKLLSGIKYDIHIYKLDVRKLQLMNYYEQDETEPALSLISSFKEFLSSNREVTADEKVKHLNMLNIVSKLLKLKDNYDEAVVSKLEKKVSDDPQLLFKWWINEKIEEIKKGNR